MTPCTRLASTLALAAALGVLPPPASAEPGVIRDSNGCRFDNPSPKPNEQVSWTGACHDGWGDGQGTLTWIVNGLPTYTYVGTVAAGKVEGEGVEKQRGSHYVGHFADGHRQGHGVFTWTDGLRYEGDFARGQIEGQGVLRLPDGTRVEGRFAYNVLQAPVTLVKTKDGAELRLPMEMPEDSAPASPTPASDVASQVASAVAGTAAKGARIDAHAPCAPTYPQAAIAQGAMGSSVFSLRVEPDAAVSRVRLDHRSGADFAHQLLDLYALAALLDCPREGAGPGGQAQWLKLTYVWKLE